MPDSHVFYSINNFDTDGVRTAFDITFAGGYISRDFVKAEYTNSDGVTTPITLGPANWVGPNQILITPALADGGVLTLYRDTPKDAPLVDFTSGSIMNEPNLDMMAEQSMHSVAEMVDRVVVAEGVVLEAVQTVQNALDTSQDALGVANSALATANTALGVANSADSRSTFALTTANNAVSTANNALDVAHGAASDASATLDIAEEARDLASAAVSTANSASSAASSATSTANTALSTAMGIDAKATEALDTANGISGTATTALTLAAQADSASAEALTLASGVDAKATAALDNSSQAIADAATALTVASGVDDKAQTALDQSDTALSQANDAISQVGDVVDAVENLGTAANGTLITSNTDNTPGRVPTVGWLGHGTGYTVDNSTPFGYLPIGFFGHVSGLHPEAVGGDGALLVLGASERKAFVYQPYAANAAYIKSSDSGSEFRRPYYTNEFVTSPPTGSTPVLRDGNGDIFARLFRSTYTTTNPTITHIYTSQGEVGTDYIRPSTPAQVKAALAIVWGDVGGKPSTFTPSSHTHPWAQITGAPTTATRWPTWGEVSGKPAIPPTNQSLAQSAIGQYAFVLKTSAGVTSYGSTVAGSQLRITTTRTDDIYGTPLPGTWRVLGNYLGETNPDTSRRTLVIRIS
ncbi:tail fiber protein [Aquamicrobium phage P14]|uniref:Putative tail fiber protein n=1 Tax=Aquamicrobium phage P14 TaxID=1927013 RepID=A0A1L5C092_9CAUD|nr:tail fiber protein [Aquamicrobium phage P14]APL99501.1 putative tail fiber protein [Aquamicrobium phage P14]